MIQEGRGERGRADAPQGSLFSCARSAASMALAHRVRTALLEPVVRPRPRRVAAPRVRWASPTPCSAGASYRRAQERPQVQRTRLGVVVVYPLPESTLRLARLRVSWGRVRGRDRGRGRGRVRGRSRVRPRDRARNRLRTRGDGRARVRLKVTGHRARGQAA